MNWFTLISFVGATAFVALATIAIVKKMKKSEDATVEYFTGGRSLGWVVVGGSLMLTNLSTEQLVGLNGAVFGDQNLAGLAWEAMAALAMIVTAAVFLPRYLASGFSTTPAFLEKRFDKTTRSITSGFFLVGYVAVLLPVVLYTGSLALKEIFGLDAPLWMVAVGIGLLGSAYAIVGGLKSVAVSDTINGVGLLIGGLAIPFLALVALGDGSLTEGVATLYRDKPETLNPLGTAESSVPWETLFTGILLINIFYWSTNQVIVQRAMGAKSLAEGQKGVLFAAALKLIGPLMLCLPGIIALHMLDPNPACASSVSSDLLCIQKNDQVYPALVKHVLPDWSLGLFAAVLVGAILSSFNSALNSASTLFSLEFYKGYIRKDADAESLVRVGKIFGSIIALLSMIIAPLLAQSESIFSYLQAANGLYAVPIVAIFLMGIWTKKIPASGAKLGMLVGFVAYTAFTIASIEGLHWIHFYAISFTLAAGVMWVVGQAAPKSAEAIAASDALDPAPVDMTPWRHLKATIIAILTVLAIIYVGLAAAAQ